MTLSSLIFSSESLCDVCFAYLAHTVICPFVVFLCCDFSIRPWGCRLIPFWCCSILGVCVCCQIRHSAPLLVFWDLFALFLDMWFWLVLSRADLYGCCDLCIAFCMVLSWFAFSGSMLHACTRMYVGVGVACCSWCLWRCSFAVFIVVRLC